MKRTGFGRARRLSSVVTVSLCIAIAGLTAGCQTTETASVEAATAAAAAASVPIPAGKARLVLTRISAYYASGVDAVVKVNGAEVARLASGTSQAVMIAPGPTAVNIDSWSAPGSYTINLEAKAGRSYRVEISPRTEAIAPAMVFGMAGALIEAAAKQDKAGAFEARIVDGAPGAQVAGAAMR
jgi:hypothetical protein